MVGFIGEPAKEDGVAANQLKLKPFANDTEGYKFDFDQYSLELDAFSFTPAAQPCLDFDAIKDWIEDMTDGEREEASGVNIGSEHQVDFIQDVKDHEKMDSVKVEYGGLDDKLVDSGTKICEVDPVVKTNGLNDCIKDEFDMGNVEPAEICCVGELKPSNGDEISNEALISNSFPKFESLGCSIQEGLEKVTLGGVPVGLIVTASDLKERDNKERDNAQASNNDESSESETETETSSSSSSSSESDVEEEKIEREQLRKITKDKTGERVDLEEGEISGSDWEEMVSWSDNDDEDGDRVVQPIKSKNELVDLPPVPPVNVTLQPCHLVSPVGIVLSVLGSQVVVEGSDKHKPLREGSILWITEKRLPLGMVDEIFGPVKTPYYIVRYNSESEVPSGIETGTLIGFVPEFVHHVLNDKSLYMKGYDASGENDEELSDGMEFSDDEQEAEYRRMMKNAKRESNNNNNDNGPGNKRNNRRNLKNRENTWTKGGFPQTSGPIQNQGGFPQTLGANQNQPNQNQSGLAQKVQSSRPIQNQGGFPQTLGPNQNQAGFPQTSGPNQNQAGFPQTSGPNQNRAGFPQAVQSPGPNQNQSGFPQTVQSSPPGFSSNTLILPVGPSGPGAFPQQGQMPSGLMINGMWVPFQQQNMNMAFPNMAFPKGCQMNGMPWLPQLPNPQISPQMPSMNPIPWQYLQQLSQFVSGSSVAPVNFANGPNNSAWPGGMLAPNVPPNQAQFFPGQRPQLPVFQGNQQQQSNGSQGGQNSNSQPGANSPGNVGARPQFNQSNGSQGGQNSNSQPGANSPGNVGARPQFNQYNGSQGGQNSNSQPDANSPGNVGARPQFNPGSSGRGRNPYHNRGRGGRSRGGRGRQQSQ